MRTYEIEIEGTTPLLMHWDDVNWADKMDAWRHDARNKKVSKAGDDRTPAWRWVGSTYHDGKVVAMPADNVMRALMEGGAMVPVPGGRGGKTFKAQTQSGMMISTAFLPLDAGDGPIPIDDINALMKVDDFEIHKQAVQQMGFSLFVKRAKIGTSKHIRVRPRFDRWKLSGSISVWDDQITRDVLTDIIGFAGQFKGLGDWRPGGKTPGSFGMFTGKVL